MTAITELFSCDTAVTLELPEVQLSSRRAKKKVRIGFSQLAFQVLAPQMWSGYQLLFLLKLEAEETGHFLQNLKCNRGLN